MLITGGAGFIGSNYVDHVLEVDSGEFFVLDKLTYAGSMKNLESASAYENFHFVLGDICEEISGCAF